MIPADKVYRITKESKDRNLKKKLDEIETAILDRANNGLYTLDYFGMLPVDVVEILKENGYNIQSNGFSTCSKICWGNVGQNP